MRSLLLVCLVSVAVLTGCGASSGSTATPAASPGGTSAASPTASSTPTASTNAGDGEQYAFVVCQALKDTLADLKGMNAPDASYQAGAVLRISSSSIPPDQLDVAMDDTAVKAECSADYEAFVAAAKISSLTEL